jgi:hypothetical protein
MTDIKEELSVKERLNKLIHTTETTRYGEEVKVLNGVFWDLFEEEIYGGLDPYSDEGINRFIAFCKKHNIHCYSRPREQFYKHQAVEQALTNKAEYLVMEDLS